MVELELGEFRDVCDWWHDDGHILSHCSRYCEDFPALCLYVSKSILVNYVMQCVGEPRRGSSKLRTWGELSIVSRCRSAVLALFPYSLVNELSGFPPFIL